MMLFILLLLCLSFVTQAQSRTQWREIINSKGEATVIYDVASDWHDTRDDRSLNDSNHKSTARQANQWRPLTQFDEGDVRALIADGQHVYAGTVNRGVFVSSDNGKTWSEANTGLGNRSINAFVSFGGGIITGAGGGVFRTVDGGQNWVATGLSNQTVIDFAVASNVLYASTTNGVFRSSDGQNWTAASNGLPTPRVVNAIEALGNALFAGTTVGVYRSTDGGQNWSAIGTGLPDSNQPIVRSLAVSGDKIYLGTIFSSTTTSQVYVSADNGQTWNAYGQVVRTFYGDGITGYSSVFALLPEGADLYACSLSVSINRGQDWSEVAGARGLPVQLTVFALVRAGGVLLAGTDRGVYALSADGANWTPSSSGLKAAIATVRASGETLIAYTRSGAIYYSSDNGQSWTQTNRFSFTDNGRPRGATAFTFYNNAWYVAGIFGVVYRSADTGQNWAPITTGLVTQGFPGASGLAVFNNKLHTVYRGTLHVLNEAETAWTSLGTLPTSSPSGSQLAADGTNIYVVSSSALSRSTDSGANFTRVSLGTPDPPAVSVATTGAEVLVGTSLGVLRSTDNGQSWTPSRTSFNAREFTQIGATLYAGSSDGVRFSNNGGANWTPVNAGLTFRNVNSLAGTGETLVAGTDGGGIFAAVNPSAQPAALTSVSAASFAPEAELAVESIVAAFGTNLATATQSAFSIPLPTVLAGTIVTVRDSTGAERRAPLYTVSDGQVNYQVPPGTSPGRATIIITSSDGSVSAGEATIANVAPGLFSANANGQGVAAAVVLRIRADGTLSYEAVSTFDAAQNLFVPVPIDLGPETDQVFLILYGTGFKFRSATSAVTAIIGGDSSEVLFAGAAPGFVGLDQCNVRLPRSLAGRNTVNVQLTVDGKAANIVTVNIR